MMMVDRQEDGSSGKHKSISRKMRGVGRKVMKAFRKASFKGKGKMSEEQPIKDPDLDNIFSLPVEVDNDACPDAMLLRSSSDSSRSESSEENSIAVDVVVQVLGEKEEESVATEENMTDDSSAEGEVPTSIPQESPPKRLAKDTQQNQKGEDLPAELPFWHRFMCGATVPTENCGTNFNLPNTNGIKGTAKIDLKGLSCIQLKEFNSPPKSKEMFSNTSGMARKSSLGHWLGSPFDRQCSDERIDKQLLSSFFGNQQASLGNEEQDSLGGEDQKEKTSLDPVELAKRQWHKDYLRLSVQRLLQEQQEEKSKNEGDATDTSSNWPTQEVIHLRHVPIRSKMISFEQSDEYSIEEESPSDEEDNTCDEKNTESGEVKDLLRVTKPESGTVVEDDDNSMVWKADFSRAGSEDSHFENTFSSHAARSATSAPQPTTVEETKPEKAQTFVASFDESNFDHAGKKGLDKDDVSVGTIVRELAELQDLQKPLKMAMAESRFYVPPPTPAPPLLAEKISSPKSSQLPFAPLSPPPSNQKRTMQFEQNNQDRYGVPEDISVGRYAVEEETSVFVEAHPDAGVKSPTNSDDLSCRAMMGQITHQHDESDPQYVRRHSWASFVAREAAKQTIPSSTRSAVLDSCNSSVNSSAVSSEGDIDWGDRRYQQLRSAESVDSPEDDSLFDEAETEEYIVRKITKAKKELQQDESKLAQDNKAPAREKEESSLTKKVAFALAEDILSSTTVSSQTNYTFKQDLLYSCVGEGVANALMQKMDKFIEDHVDGSESDEGSSDDEDFFEKLTDDDASGYSSELLD